MNPTADGPAAHPRSPAKERKANMAVLAPGHLNVARLKTPGHIIPTENPQSPHPISDTNGLGASAVIR